MIQETTISGKNLIFLISQPRSGSTLLQRILACHSDIYTLAEPWIMLPPLFDVPFKAQLPVPYDNKLCAKATREFFQSLPNGDQEYYDGVRRMALWFYQRSLEKSGNRLFLDKTPRYYSIIPELARTFPDAKIILLARNPLAVLGSIINSWTGENWYSLADYKHDLCDAPRQMVEGMELLGQKGHYVKYESLLEDPEKLVKQLCDYLEIEFSPGMIQYGKHDLPKWNLGATGVYKHSAPVADNVDKWKKSLKDPQFWRTMHDYLELLDEGVLRRFGYEKSALMKELLECAPPKKRLAYTYALSALLNPSELQRSSPRPVSMKLRRALQLKGHRGTAIRAVTKTLGAK